MAETITEVRLKCTVEKHGPAFFFPDLDPTLRMVRHRAVEIVTNYDDDTMNGEITITSKLAGLGLETVLGAELLGRLFAHDLFEGQEEMQIKTQTLPEESWF